MTHFNTQWVLPPATVKDLAGMYHSAELLLKKPRITRDRYRQALISYTRYLEHLQVFLPGWSERFAFYTHELERLEIKALFHRINCQVLQLLAHKEVCKAPCCCDCPASDPALPCIGFVFGQLHENMIRSQSPAN